MLQTHVIINNKEAVVEAMKKRHIDISDLATQVIELDENRRKAQFTLDTTLSSSNKLSKEIGLLFNSGKKEEANKLREKTIALKEKVKILQADLEKITKELLKILYQIPNVPNSKVSIGKSDKDNDVVFEENALFDIPSNALPHWELAEQYDIINFELGNKITGSGFPVYKGKGAKLQRAMINYFLDQNIKEGYTEYQPPYVINEASGFGTGQLPDKEGQMYRIDRDDLYLIPTAEVPVTNFFRNTLLQEKELPILCTAYTPCFRREAGSYGSHVRGLNRLHQFDKVEIVRVEHPDNSYKALDAMITHIKNILRALKLPYRILRLCGGDLGFTSALTYDFEVFSSVQKRWLEVSSVSNFETFQTNRLKLKFKNKEGKSSLAHTLNGSALALPRILAALLENNQTTKGIQIPKVLQHYTGFSIIN